MTGRWLAAVLLPVAPLCVAAFFLSWLGSGEGVSWAHSLWTKDHPLNFGGNPAEVLSHLLNWIVMATCTAGLCLASIAAVFSRTESDSERQHTELPFIVSCLATLTVLIWAVDLDSEHGEGTVGMSFVIFFGPCTLASAMALRGIWSSGSHVVLKVLLIATMFPLSLVLQWFYESSGTGGPNVLAFPLLFGQIVIWWFIGRAFRREPSVKVGTVQNISKP